MQNAFDEIERAKRQADELNRALDRQATSLAGLLKGRLRHVDWKDDLRALKRELRDFDMTTGKWK